jgi:hypothetical protein
MSQKNPDRPSFSIVIETDNLALVDLGELYSCLDSIVDQGDLIKQAVGVFVADGGVVPENILSGLRSRYPWLTVVHAEAGASYIELKLAGALKAGSEVIVFCDGDVHYEKGWLAALLDGFRSHPDADMIAGETTTLISGPYSLAFALTFNFPRLSQESDLAPSTIYWANNVAVKRELLLRIPLPDPAELYRGQNLVHTAQILRNSGKILRQPKAKSWHAVLPPSEIVQRYFRLGRDAAMVRTLTARESGSAHLGAMAPDRHGGGVFSRITGRFGQIARSQPWSLLHLPLAAPVVVLMGVAYLAGRLSAPNSPKSPIAPKQHSFAG